MSWNSKTKWKESRSSRAETILISFFDFGDLVIPVRSLSNWAQDGLMTRLSSVSLGRVTRCDGDICLNHSTVSAVWIIYTQHISHDCRSTIDYV